MDFGGILMQATNYSDGWANKGVSIQNGKYAALLIPKALLCGCLGRRLASGEVAVWHYIDVKIKSKKWRDLLPANGVFLTKLNPPTSDFIE